MWPFKKRDEDQEEFIFELRKKNQEQLEYITFCIKEIKILKEALNKQ